MKNPGHSGTLLGMAVPDLSAENFPATDVPDEGDVTICRPVVGKGGSVDSVSGRSVDRPRELGGPTGPEPTRYGDWERGGRCIDF